MTTITLLADDRAQLGRRAEHGLAMLVRHGDADVLFDAGASDLLLANARDLGCDLGAVRAVVLSHGHYDHTGGLDAVLAAVPPDVPVWAAPGVTDPRYSRRAARETREVGFRGGPATVARLRLVTAPTEVAPGVWVTGPIPRVHPQETPGLGLSRDAGGAVPDTVPDDQALVVRPDAGPPVLVLGCTHAGVVNTMTFVERWLGNDAYAAVVGGLHLLHADAARLDWTVDQLRRRRIARLGPCHCTGVDAMARLATLAGPEHLDWRAGARLDLG